MQQFVEETEKLSEADIRNLPKNDASVERKIKLGHAVGLQQFFTETENVSESEMYLMNLSESNEASVAKKISSNVGKIYRGSPLPPASPKAQSTFSKAKLSSQSKKGSRTRKRGRKRSDGRETKNQT